MWVTDSTRVILRRETVLRVNPLGSVVDSLISLQPLKPLL